MSRAAIYSWGITSQKCKGMDARDGNLSFRCCSNTHADNQTLYFSLCGATGTQEQRLHERTDRPMPTLTFRVSCYTSNGWLTAGWLSLSKIGILESLPSPFHYFHANCPALECRPELIVYLVVYFHVQPAGRDLCAPLERLR